jgi:cytochrome b561
MSGPALHGAALGAPVLRYTRIAVVLHWVIAVLIVGNVALALSADSLPDAWVRPVIDTHKSIGITVLGLALLRLLWRAGHPAPPLPEDYPRWQRLAAHVVHVALYGLILALPLSGWMHDSAWNAAASHPMRLFNLMPWPRISWILNLAPGEKERLHTVFGNLHTWLGYTLYALLALHVGAALKHQFIDKQRELQRITF